MNIRPTSFNNVYPSVPAKGSKRLEQPSKPTHFGGQHDSQAEPNEFAKLWHEIRKANLRDKLVYIFVGFPILLSTLFLKHTAFRKDEISSTLTYQRGKKSSFDRNMDRARAGLPDVWPRGDMDSVTRPAWFLIWNQVGSEALVKATVHLDPDYRPYTPNLQLHKYHKDDEEELRDLNEDLKKYEIPDPPPRLSMLDRFLLKYYFKTKPSWEYTEAEREAISASFRDTRA